MKTLIIILLCATNVLLSIAAFGYRSECKRAAASEALLQKSLDEETQKLNEAVTETARVSALTARAIDDANAALEMADKVARQRDYFRNAWMAQRNDKLE